MIQLLKPIALATAKSVGRGASAAFHWLNFNKRDYTGIVGMVALGVGIGAIMWPAGLISVGVVLLYMAHGGGRRGMDRRGDGSGSDGGASGQ